MAVMQTDDPQAVVQEVPYEVVRPILSWVYIWMFFGLAVTAVVAWATVNNDALLALLNRTTFLIVLFAQLGITIAITAAMQRMSQGVMTLLYFAYTALTGFVFAVILLVFDVPTIATAFISTAGVFGVMSVVGFTTKINLMRFGGYLLMALIGLLIAMVVNIFLNNPAFDFIISIFGVLLFTGLVAYKTQLIKTLAAQAALTSDEAMQAKVSLYGAFTLYLTFINLFLFILRLLGGRRR